MKKSTVSNILSACLFVTGLILLNDSKSNITSAVVGTSNLAPKTIPIVGYLS